ncbi:hypothetical protein [Sorangium sp. So ce1182]|uniref:hypothetical protein n=1 Tax=Sorangium sp. So ce1182 TaxID=3133334 RepID=UPI003F5EA1B1
MPFTTEQPVYKAMAETAGVISTAIESLGVQVRWAGVRIQGVAPGDVNKFEPLVHALAHGGGLEEALSVFTVRIFCYGNVAVYVGPQAAVEWPADWRRSAARVEAANAGHVLEARRAPVDAEGYGTSALEPGVQAFRAFVAGEDAKSRELEEFIRNPMGPLPGPSAADDLRRMNNVLRAIGFDAWDPKGDLPAFRGAAQLRAQMKTLFEREMLEPYAAAKGIPGHPVLVL